MTIERLSREEITAAVAALLNRIRDIEAESCERFPLFCPVDRPWKLSSGGSWMGGFWAGAWWLTAFKTQSPIDRDTANKISQRLAEKLDSDTLQRSLIFNYGSKLGDRLFSDPVATNLYQLAGSAIAQSGRPELGFIPLGQAMGGGPQGEQTFSIDPLASTLSLLCATGFQQQAEQQMSVAVKACYDQDGRWHAEACCQSGLFTHRNQAGDWARGQAWAMLALTQAVHQLGHSYLPLARQSAEYWLAQYHDSLPLNRLSQPEGEYDPCASVMACVAMLGLVELTMDMEWLRPQALRQLAAVVRSPYFKEGRFIGHCYRLSVNEEHCVESPCGIFFLLAALMVVDKQIDPLWF